MKPLQYLIDGNPLSVNMQGSSEFKHGRAEVLSNSETDITYGLDWHHMGYHAFEFLSPVEHQALVAGLTKSVAAIISELGIDTAGFKLDDYHKTVTTTELHHQVASRTRDLFAKDFNFPIEEMIPRFEQLVGFGLTDFNPHVGEKMHIIVRINRPGSNDFNPPHKDMYGPWDREGLIMRFMNLWIPVCGVTNLSSLPVAPGSHLIAEDKVLRTFEGAVTEGNKYRVNAIAAWDGRSELIRPVVKDGEVLMFSSHLIHGLAKNELPDTTRVALEFRLFRKN